MGALMHWCIDALHWCIDALFWCHITSLFICKFGQHCGVSLMTTDKWFQECLIQSFEGLLKLNLKVYTLNLGSSGEIG